jgi:hypothetical protein
MTVMKGTPWGRVEQAVNPTVPHRRSLRQYVMSFSFVTYCIARTNSGRIVNAMDSDDDTA